MEWRLKGYQVITSFIIILAQTDAFFLLYLDTAGRLSSPRISWRDGNNPQLAITSY
jgi:hypothetical protein